MTIFNAILGMILLGVILYVMEERKIGVREFLNCVAKKPKAPQGMNKKTWGKITSPGETGKWGEAGQWIGYADAYISFAAFYLPEAYTIIVAWLAFKVATKWEVWRNVIQVPEFLEDNSVPQLDWLAARRTWGGWILSRFLLGTAANVFIGGFLGFLLGNIPVK